MKRADHSQIIWKQPDLMYEHYVASIADEVLAEVWLDAGLWKMRTDDFRRKECTSYPNIDAAKAAADDCLKARQGEFAAHVPA